MAFLSQRTPLSLILTLLSVVVTSNSNSFGSPASEQLVQQGTSFLQSHEGLLSSKDPQALNSTPFKSQPQPHHRDGNNEFMLNFNPSLSLKVPDLGQTFTDFGGAVHDLFENFNRTSEQSRGRNSSNELDHQVIVFPEILIRQSFEKGESGWLTRQKSIDSLWIHNGGAADPKSSLGTAFAFNAPNPHSLSLANVSVLLEYASRAFLKGLNKDTEERSKSAQNNESPRFKRQNNFLGNDLITERSSLARVDITPFVPAQQYIANCGVSEDKQACDGLSPYRTYSGWCNNLRNPGWGKSVTPFDRMIPPVYGDRISAPKTLSVTGQLLPSPRYVSSTVHVDVSHLSQKHTLMFMQYAQFLDHDVTFTPVNKGPRDAILNCRDCNSGRDVHPECWPIPVPTTDSYYPSQAAASSGQSYCIPFTRSLPGQQRLGPREQINQNSAYLDSSHIYGESYCKAMSLRSGGGMLNVTFHPTHGGKVLMPQITQMKECKSPSGYCFYAGDPRASEQPALAAVHTVFLREHNRIAEELHHVNPHWSEEKLYQQSRRILTAVNQHIAYNEFLPRLIGPTLINAYGLRLQNEGYYTSYDPTCSAAAFNEFAAAAFRFGHSLIRPQLPRMDHRYNGMTPHIPLRNGFFNSDMLYKSLMVDEILRGLIAEPMEQLDPFITKEITNHLFEDNKKSFSGMDLIALNLHRGRDHGLPGYNAYRAACNLPKVSNFADLQSEIPVDVISRLQHVYAHVDDIDLFTGSLVERPVNGGIIGPTMSCIIGSQFKRLRQCDRFWYETNDPLLKFTPRQLAEIRKVTLSKVLCDNFDVSSDIPKSSFDAPHNFLNPRMPCDRLPKMFLEAWREKAPTAHRPSQGCKIGNRQVRVGEAGLPTPCVSCICTPEGTKCASLRITSCSQLFREARREDILQDNVCTSQCGPFLGSRGSGENYSQHNDLQLQSLLPPAPAPGGRFSTTTGGRNIHNLFNIVNGRGQRL